MQQYKDLMEINAANLYRDSLYDWLGRCIIDDVSIRQNADKHLRILRTVALAFKNLFRLLYVFIVLFF